MIFVYMTGCRGLSLIYIYVNIVLADVINVHKIRNWKIVFFFKVLALKYFNLMWGIFRLIKTRVGEF